MCETVRVKFYDDRLVIRLIGTIDASNADDVEQKILFFIRDLQTKIILDAEELESISAAGLRALLHIRQHQPFELINVSQSIFDTLSTAGFTEILPVKKALPQVSIAGCEIIGKGAFGNIYRHGQDAIVKVMGEGCPPREIENEMAKSRLAFIYELPTAIPLGTVMTEEGVGLVFEMVEAESLATVWMNEPESRDELFEKYYHLFWQIGNTKTQSGELEQISDTFKACIYYLAPYLPGRIVSEYLRLMDNLPKTNTLVHGDLHTNNVLVRDNELVLIDLADLGCGHPVFELLSLYQAFVYVPTYRPHVMWKAGVSVEEGPKIWERFAERYFQGVSAQTKRDRLRAIEIMSRLFRIRFRTKLIQKEDPKDGTPFNPTETESFQSALKHLEAVTSEVDFLLETINAW